MCHTYQICNKIKGEIFNYFLGACSSYGKLLFLQPHGKQTANILSHLWWNAIASARYNDSFLQDVLLSLSLAGCHSPYSLFSKRPVPESYVLLSDVFIGPVHSASGRSARHTLSSTERGRGPRGPGGPSIVKVALLSCLLCTVAVNGNEIHFWPLALPVPNQLCSWCFYFFASGFSKTRYTDNRKVGVRTTKSKNWRRFWRKPRVKKGFINQSFHWTFEVSKNIFFRIFGALVVAQNVRKCTFWYGPWLGEHDSLLTGF